MYGNPDTDVADSKEDLLKELLPKGSFLTSGIHRSLGTRGGRLTHWADGKNGRILDLCYLGLK